MKSIVYQGKLYRSLKEEIESEKKSYNSRVFDIESIHKCPRQQIIKYGIGSKVENTNKSIHDNFIKSKWAEIFKRCTKIRLVNSSAVLSDANCNISLNSSAIIEFKDDIYITYIKPVDSDTYNKIKSNGPMKKDVITCQAHIWLSELQNGMIIYEDLSSQEYEIFFINKDVGIINFIENRLRYLNSYQISGKIPPVPKENENRETSKECINCEFRDKCYKLDNK